MADKLQELTDRLYNEGLSKGREEGERILAKAREEADRILSEAREEAAAIKSKAGNDAINLKSKAESDIRMASAQVLQATKKDVENLLVNAISASETEKNLADVSFIKEIIRTVAEKFSAEESGDMAFVLPASMQKDLEPWISGELKKAIGAGIKAEFSKKIAGGFTLGPGDGGWFISLTDETFKELIAEYIRPVTRKLLFGE